MVGNAVKMTDGAGELGEEHSGESWALSPAGGCVWMEQGVSRCVPLASIWGSHIPSLPSPRQRAGWAWWVGKASLDLEGEKGPSVVWGSWHSDVPGFAQGRGRAGENGEDEGVRRKRCDPTGALGKRPNAAAWT